MAVLLFLYFGQMLLSTDGNCLEMERNLWRAQGKWGRMVKILVRDGSYKRTAGKFYVAVVQEVLLFGSETRVLTPRFDKSLEGFHHRSERQMAGMGTKRHPDGTCV